MKRMEEASSCLGRAMWGCCPPCKVWQGSGHSRWVLLCAPGAQIQEAPRVCPWLGRPCSWHTSVPWLLAMLCRALGLLLSLLIVSCQSC